MPRLVGCCELPIDSSTGLRGVLRELWHMPAMFGVLAFPGIPATQAQAAAADTSGVVNRNCTLTQYRTWRTNTVVRIDLNDRDRMHGPTRMGLRGSDGVQFTNTRQFESTGTYNLGDSVRVGTRFAMQARCVDQISWTGWHGHTWHGKIYY